MALNYTLQFIPLQQRDSLISRLYQGMNQGAALVISEKIAFDQKQQHQHFTDLHHQFKSLNGYSDLEISQKRQAIENVLIPETLEAHERRLKQAGFSQVHSWFQCFNFASLIAVK